MSAANFYNIYVKIIFLNICMFYIFSKAINLRKLNRTEILISMAALVVSNYIYNLLYFNLSSLIALIFVYVFSVIIVFAISKLNLIYVAFNIMVSWAISLGIYTVSLFIAATIRVVIFNDLNEEDVFVILMAAIINIFILYVYFKMKRFKNGITFLKNEKISRYGIVGLIGTIVVISAVSLIVVYKNQILEYSFLLVVGIVIACVIIIVWSRRNITLFYKESIKEEEIIDLYKEVEAKEFQNNKLVEELREKALLIHKYASRIAAVEYVVNTKTEVAEESGDIKILVQNLKEDFKNENDRKKLIVHIQKTENIIIDSMVKYFSEEMLKNKIEFKFIVKSKIEDFIKEIKSEGKLVTLIADHIKNAIIAINASSNEHRKITVTFGKVNGICEISFNDTGIPFETNILKQLGKRPITTHKDEGGTGLGFMTTFETLRECRASLIIEGNYNSLYRKSIVIRFDNKNEYIICKDRICSPVESE